MSDIFEKIASDFISEEKSAPSNNGDIFDKLASDFISKRASSLSQPLRSSYDYGERHANSFIDMDEDGDGRISPEEWEEGFDGLDSDNSGFLQGEEWDNPNFDLLDEDGDGVISRDEWSEGFDEIDDDDDGFISETEYYKSASDLTEIDDIVDDLQEDLSEVDGIVDDLVDEEEFSGRFVEDFDSELEMHKSARFSKGEEGKKEFDQWKEDNPEAAEEFDKQTEINKDVVKNRARAMSSDDFQDLDEEQQETEDKIKNLESRVDKLQDDKDGVVNSVSKKADHHHGSYMSLQNVHEMYTFLDSIDNMIGHEDNVKELDDWVEDKISHAHGLLQDLHRYFSHGRGYDSNALESAEDYHGLNEEKYKF